ncbi:YiiX/YebB-like N1pC/P60 family cysteine hydrolase [Sphingobacterium thalpophilum]|uniref:YiiX/YebB-like N1pC/P60 family cysteine hydrolase n=1 Tax=Sphingobacterium thalpophilum TaxID=259 RepID=UPI0037DA4759
MKKYIFDLTKIRAGDILLLNVDPRYSAIMEKNTGSAYHHAMLYVGESSHIHSNKGPGVQAENTLRILFDSPGAAIALRLKNPEDFFLISRIVDVARTKVGTEYSGEEAKRTVQGHTEADFDPNRQFCTRFVAQAYMEGGIQIVEDPNYCTPFDLTSSEKMAVINDVLTEASDEQVAYASEETTVLSKQIAINNHIFSSARKITGADIQTFNQLTEYLLSQSEHDKEITAIIEKSGYLELWKTDMQQNPQYYDFETAIKIFDKKHWLSVSSQLEAIAKRNLYRYEINLSAYKEIYVSHPLAYIDMHVKLYDKLVEGANKILEVAQKLREAAE